MGNFGGQNFWRISGSKVFGEEKFGKSVGSLLKTLAFINIGGENFGELPTVHQILQNFPTYGTLYMHTIVVGVNFDGHAGVVVASRLRYMWCRAANIDIVWTPVVKKGNLVFGPVFRHLLTVLQIGTPYFNNLPQGDLEIPCKLNKFFWERQGTCVIVRRLLSVRHVQQ